MLKVHFYSWGWGLVVFKGVVLPFWWSLPDRSRRRRMMGSSMLGALWPLKLEAEERGERRCEDPRLLLGKGWFWGWRREMKGSVRADWPQRGPNWDADGGQSHDNVWRHCSKSASILWSSGRAVVMRQVKDQARETSVGDVRAEDQGDREWQGILLLAM